MSKDQLALDHVYSWEKAEPNKLWITQPIGNGEVKTYTWAEAMDQVRQMALDIARIGDKELLTMPALTPISSGHDTPSSAGESNPDYGKR